MVKNSASVDHFLSYQKSLIVYLLSLYYEVGFQMQMEAPNVNVEWWAS